MNLTRITPAPVASTSRPLALQPRVSSRGRRCTCKPMALFGGLFGGSKESSKEAAKPQEPAKNVANAEVFMREGPMGANEQPEFPPFQTVSRSKDYDLRLYGSYPVVEMQYERREEGYAALGAFIDGDNADGVRFAYTQPVTMVYSPSGAKAMQMFLGSQRGSSKGDGPVSLAALPAPKDATVRVNIAGGELIAVSRFEGYITPSTAGEARSKLLEALKRDGIKLSEEAAAGGFRVGQYGAVYQLAGRINEMYVKVSL